MSTSSLAERPFPPTHDGNHRSMTLMSSNFAKGAPGFLAVLSFAIAVSASAIPKTPVPDQWAGSSVVILEDSLLLDFQPAKDRNNLDVREHCWYKVSPSGGADIRAFTFWDAEFIESRPDIDVTTYDSLGNRDRLGGSCFVRERSSENPNVKYSLYFGKTGSFETTVVIPSFDRVRYILTSVHRPHMKPAFVGRYVMRNRFPTVHKTVLISSPMGTDLFWGISSGEGLALDTSTAVDRKRIVTRIACSNLIPLPDRLLEHSEQWLASIELRIPPKGPRLYSWKDLGEYGLDIMESEQKPSRSADSIASTLPSDRSKVLQAAFSYVKQHLRYYGSWEGTHGFVPRSCEDVLRNGYGDCKELATVLCALLRAKGVSAGLALLSARAVFPEMNLAYPTMGVFNHVIVAVHTDSGFRYLDPTVNFANAGNSYFRLAGRKTLVLARGASCVDSVVEAPGFRNEVRSASKLLMRANGAWVIEGELWHYGLAAQDLESVLESRINQTETTALSGYLKSAFRINAASPVVRTNTADSVCVSFSCSFDECAIRVPHPGFVVKVPSLCSWFAPDPDAVDEGPVACRDFAQTDAWIVPEGKTMHSAFAALDKECFRGSWKIRNDTLSRTFASRPALFTSAKSPECRKFAVERSRFEKGTVWKE